MASILYIGKEKSWIYKSKDLSNKSRSHNVIINWSIKCHRCIWHPGWAWASCKVAQGGARKSSKPHPLYLPQKLPATCMALILSMTDNTIIIPKKNSKALAVNFNNLAS